MRDENHFLVWQHFPVVARQIRQTYPSAIWQKQWQIYLFLVKSFKNYYNNLYLHHKSFKITFKSNSYLTSICRRGPITSSTQTFPNFNLKSYLLFEKSLKKGCDDLYFHSFVFNMSYNHFLF